MQLYATLTPCMTVNCVLHYSNYVRSTFKAEQEKWPLLSCHRWYVANFELVFPSREVVRVDWLSVGWL